MSVPGTGSWPSNGVEVYVRSALVKPDLGNVINS
jgi:hypothetical protein